MYTNSRSVISSSANPMFLFRARYPLNTPMFTDGAYISGVFGGEEGTGESKLAADNQEAALGQGAC
jgi:hypothetical protein